METNTVEVLNDLIQASKDGEQGFRQCAEHAKDPQLRQFFAIRARMCGTAATELQRLIPAPNDRIETSGSGTGAMHRGWVNVRTALSSDDDKVVLEECERGEDMAVREYRRALAADLPRDVRMIVAQQLEGVMRNHDEVKALRERHRNHAG